MQELLDKGKCCDLLVYLNRPRDCIHYKYAAFHNSYTWSCQRPPRFNVDTSYEVRIQGLVKMVYICPRANVTNTITRIGMLYVTAGEIWYERQLRIHRACISFKDMRSVDGEEYPTFQEALEPSTLQPPTCRGPPIKTLYLRDGSKCFNVWLITSSLNSIRFM